MHLRYLHKNGLKIQMQLVLFLSQDDMEAHLHIQILLLNLLHGFLLNLRCM